MLTILYDFLIKNILNTVIQLYQALILSHFNEVLTDN